MPRCYRKIFDALQKWENTWLMSFNLSKCSILRSCPSRSPINSTCSYFIHNTTLQRSKTCKYLGVTISDDLKWSSHIAIITKKPTNNSDSYDEIQDIYHGPSERLHINLLYAPISYSAPVCGTPIPPRIPRNWKKSSARLLVMSQLIIKGVAV